MTTTTTDMIGAYAYADTDKEGKPLRRPVFVVGGRPQVMVKLKRMIPGARQDPRSGHLWITATRELARDLEWFCLRYPLTAADPRSQETLARMAGEHKAGEETVMRILGGELPPLAPERELGLTPREYQLVPRAMCRAQGYLLLGDDTGLGKTFEAGLMFTDMDALLGMVVAPKHLVTQWQERLAQYFPWLNTHILRQGTPYANSQKILLNRLEEAHVVLTTYHKVYGWADYLKGRVQTILFDEAQELRTGPGTIKYDGAMQVARGARYVMHLTATPVYNYGDEVHNVVSILNPDVLGTMEEFAKEHGGKNVKNPRALGAHLRDSGIMLRRTRKDVGRELPPVSSAVQPVETNHQRLKAELEQGVVAMAAKVLAADTGREERWSMAGRLEMKVRHATGVAKAPYVAEFVKMLLTREQKVVLVGHHHDCFVAGTKVLMYDGSQRDVEKVRRGELVMGPDSKPRTVKSLVRGNGNLYRVVPKKGDPWVCSENHILTVWNERGFYEQMTAREFYEMPETSRRRRSLYRAESVGFGGAEQVVEPWLMGFWLGDGAASLNDLRVCSRDPEIHAEMQQIAERHGLVVREWAAKGASGTGTSKHLCLSTGRPGPGNPLVRHFRALNLHCNKHIPQSYLTAPPADRRELLAGLIDADANVHPGQWTRTATFTTIDREFAEQVAFLSRSLGLAAYIKTKTTSAGGYGAAGRTYYNVSISGDLTQLPMRIERKKAQPRPSTRNVLRDRFTIEPVGAGDFYGFEVDADNLFLLGDFTVVHNCYEIWQKALAEYKPVLYTGKQSDTQKQAAINEFVDGDARVFMMALRSGTGIDGLQKACSVMVFGELDWSPAQHKQIIDRLNRDGQPDPVAVFYMLSDAGSDPPMEELLELKRRIAEPITNPDAEIVAPSPAEAMARVRALAEAVLHQHGIDAGTSPLPDPVPGSGELFPAAALTAEPAPARPAGVVPEPGGAGRCGLCGRATYLTGELPEGVDDDAIDCGGDCWGCIRDVEARDESELIGRALPVPVGDRVPADRVSGPGRALGRYEMPPVNAAGQVPSDMVPYYETQQGLAEMTAAEHQDRLDQQRRLHVVRDDEPHRTSRDALRDRLAGDRT